MSYAKQFILEEFHFDITSLLKKSKILEQIHTQKTLLDSFTSKP